MNLQIVNPDPRYAPAALMEPTSFGYIHLAAEVHPPHRPGPLLLRGRAKSHLLANLAELARELERVGGVEKVTVYEAIAFPPFGRFPYVKERADRIRFPRFDVVVLVETTSLAAIRQVQGTVPYRTLLDTMRKNARRVHEIAARNAKRIGDVDKSRQGLFLFTRRRRVSTTRPCSSRSKARALTTSPSITPGGTGACRGSCRGSSSRRASARSYRQTCQPTGWARCRCSIGSPGPRIVGRSPACRCCSRRRPPCCSRRSRRGLSVAGPAADDRIRSVWITETRAGAAR